MGDHLPEGIDVAGVAGHDIAGGIGVEIADGELLHFGEGFIPNLLLDALGDTYHQVALQEAGYNADDEYAGQANQVTQQRAEVGRAGGYHGENEIGGTCFILSQKT